MSGSPGEHNQVMQDAGKDRLHLRSRPHALASLTTWRVLAHGLESEPDNGQIRTILWPQFAEVRLAVERDRRDRRRRCDITTRAGDRLTIYGPAPGRFIDARPEGDYAAIVTEIVTRARMANPACRLVSGRFMLRLVAFHTLVLATAIVFVEFIGQFSGMKAGDPAGFLWLQASAIGFLAFWTALVILVSMPRRLDPASIPRTLLDD